MRKHSYAGKCIEIVFFYLKMAGQTLLDCGPIPKMYKDDNYDRVCETYCIPISDGKI